MTSIIKLQPLAGAQAEGPLCYLLQIDDFSMLLDCGWDENFSDATIAELKKHAKQVDVVLLSYPDLYHLGALAYLVGKCGLSCPIYATMPVYKMGQMFMYDLYQSRNNTEEFETFTLDDVDAAFDRITQLKYSQTVNLKGKGQGLQITPLPAGHMIGGTIWKIAKEGEDDIIYAVDYNHKKERHLNGCVMESLNRPSLLITDAYNASYQQARRRLRDEQLLTTILQTLRGSGNVLVTVDTAGRVLELVQLLETMWRNPDSGLMAYSIALLNNVCYNVVEFAKSQVEWMSDKIIRGFEDRRNNPFQFKHVQLCHSLSEVHRLPNPKVVLASVPDLQSGFSRDLFVDWCSDPRNTVVLTTRSSPGTLARRLTDNPSYRSIDLEVKKRVPLEGEELEEFMRRKREQTADARISGGNEKDDGQTSSDESDIEAEEADVHAPGERQVQHDLLLRGDAKIRSGFFKQVKRSYPMFPYVEERIKWDEYGEIVKPEDFNFADPAATVDEPTAMDTDAVEVKAIAGKGSSAAGGGGGGALGERGNQEPAPTKCISWKQHFEVRASVLYIDFEGRSDGESIKKLLEKIRPRQLVLVHGTKESIDFLADFCRSNGIVQGKISTPQLYEVVNATTDSHIYQVKLKDSLVSRLKLMKAKEVEVAWIDAQVRLSDVKIDAGAVYEPEDGEVTEDAEKKRLTRQPRESAVAKTERGDFSDIVPTLELPPGGQVTVPGHVAIFVNEPKLSNFKQVLVKHGFHPEFALGVLVVNDVVAIRRNESGRIELEGCLCPEYYRVRELLYDQYAIL